MLIGDIGIGIPESLRSNTKYKNLSNTFALLTAFKPYEGNGTIISILFIDGQFGSKKREDVKNYIDKCLVKV